MYYPAGDFDPGPCFSWLEKCPQKNTINNVRHLRIYGFKWNASFFYTNLNQFHKQTFIRWLINCLSFPVTSMKKNRSEGWFTFCLFKTIFFCRMPIFAYSTTNFWFFSTEFFGFLYSIFYSRFIDFFQSLPS